MKMKALIIAPYEGLKELVNTISPEYPDMEITIEDGNMDQGVRSFRLSGGDQYDVILSRGETAALLRRQTSIPVLDIGVSSFDIMHAILLSKNFNGKTALVGFPSIAEAARLVMFGLEEKVDIITLTRAEDIDSILADLKKSGYKTVIGDVYSSDVAAREAFNSILLTSGENSLRQTFQLAASIYRNTKKYSDRASLLSCILETSPCHVFAVDETGQIVYANAEIEPVLQSALLSEAGSVLSQAAVQQHLKLNDNIYDISGEKISCPDGDLAVFHVKESLLARQYDGWIQVCSYQNGRQYPLSVLGSIRRFLDEYIPLAGKYSQTEDPVTIIGEEGTGKAHLARLIHTRSNHRCASFIHVSCDAIPENGFQIVAEYLSDSSGKPAAPTLFLENLDSLSEKMQHEFLSFLGVLPSGSCRLVVSLAHNPDTCPALNRKITEALGAYRIYIKSLEQCPEIIPEIVGQLISEANQNLGRQIIAIEEDGMRLLQYHHWKGNLNQLDHVIQSACLTAGGPVISAEEIKAVLQEEPAETEAFCLEGSLEEITLRIIREVLKQEEGNSSRAARRLGISRSTLWRKLGNDQKAEKSEDERA